MVRRSFPGARAPMTGISAALYEAQSIVNVFFGHRRVRSTVAITTRNNLFTFEVRRSQAMALQTRLANSPRERAHALAEFIGRWRQQ